MDNYETLKQSLTVYCRSRGSTWKPSNEELKNIEEYAFVGILEPRTIATLLHVDYREFIASTFIYESIVKAIDLGKARALLTVNTTLMGVSTGAIDPMSIDFRALKFLCTSRFGYDENAVQSRETRKNSRTKNRIEREKLVFAKEVHKERIDLETTKMAMTYNNEELESLKQGEEGSRQQ